MIRTSSVCDRSIDTPVKSCRILRPFEKCLKLGIAQRGETRRSRSRNLKCLLQRGSLISDALCLHTVSLSLLPLWNGAKFVALSMNKKCNLKTRQTIKLFARIKNSQEERVRERRAWRDGANFAGNAENQNTNLLHIWHKQHTHTHTHASGAKSSKTPLGLAVRKSPR